MSELRICERCGQPEGDTEHSEANRSRKAHRFEPKKELTCEDVGCPCVTPEAVVDTPTLSPEGMSDPTKLHVLADWFDRQDSMKLARLSWDLSSPVGEVQKDLHRIANELARIRSGTAIESDLVDAPQPAVVNAATAKPDMHADGSRCHNPYCCIEHFASGGQSGLRFAKPPELTTGPRAPDRGPESPGFADRLTAAFAGAVDAARSKTTVEAARALVDYSDGKTPGPPCGYSQLEDELRDAVDGGHESCHVAQADLERQVRDLEGRLEAANSVAMNANTEAVRLLEENRRLQRQLERAAQPDPQAKLLWDFARLLTKTSL